MDDPLVKRAMSRNSSLMSSPKGKEKVGFTISVGFAAYQSIQHL